MLLTRARQVNGIDHITTVPTVRWDSLPTTGRTPTGHPGFVANVRGAQRFDNLRFSVSIAEASATDPCQRLLLEQCYEALHMAHITRWSVAESLGIFLGVDKCDWAAIRPASVCHSTYAMAGGSNAIASGRLSYVFGLQAPCVTFDTACSSALSATHGALRSLQLRLCEAALANGVNLNLSPSMHALFYTAGLASPTGRCVAHSRTTIVQKTDFITWFVRPQVSRV